MLVIVLRKKKIKKVKFFASKGLKYYLYIIMGKLLFYKVKVVQ